ncbi:UNVERIFIED_CONTAM: hypothetical protein Slati_2518600 [Sesamum latifolium]|uniref:Uncharacterized protein n=1 Tax=Sesamum latifolium TaxID=2727402 RepID=A0AAW2WI61_9LAMI
MPQPGEFPSQSEEKPAKSRRCLDLGGVSARSRWCLNPAGGVSPTGSKRYLGSVGGAPPLGRGGASSLDGASSPPVGVPSLHFEHSVLLSDRQWDDVLRYMQRYSPDHIATILSLHECLPSDSGDYLEDSNDYDSDDTGGDETQSDNQVEEEVFDSVGEDDHDKTNVFDKETLGEDDGDETDISDVRQRPE